MTESSPGHPEPQALLAEEDFLRGLLRGLLRDDRGIDDLLQQTWLQALLHPPRDAGRLRAFLAQIARNLAHEEGRKQKRRSHHERQAARPENAMPSPEDLLQKEADRRRVIDALLTLPEPYRGTVILRYYQQLSPAQIARRLQVPAATIRSRLHRGLSMLRERLDATYGKRSDWVMALLPLAQEKPLGLPNLGSGVPLKALTSIVSIMSAKSKIALTACAMVFCAIASFFALAEGPMPGDLDAEPTDTLALEGVSLGTGTESSNPVAQGEDDATERTPVENGSPWALRGKVRRMSGGPLPGAMIAIETYLGYRPLGEPVSRVVVQANERGEFFWANSPPTEASSFRLLPANPRHRARATKILSLPNEAAPAEIALRFIELTVELHGTITGPDRERVEGAIISSSDWLETESDAQGQYRLQVPVRTLPLAISTKGYADARINVTVPAGVERLRQDIQLIGGHILHGLVQDHNGEAIAAATVHCLQSSNHLITCDKKGRFVIDHLDPRRANYTISARADGYLKGYAEVIRDVDEITITLRPGQQVSGQVLTAGGEPVHGAEIFILHNALNNGDVDAVSGPDGYFEIDTLAPDQYLLSARRRSYALAIQNVLVTADADVEGLRIILENGRPLAGQVTDEAGNPIPDAYIYMQGPENDSVVMRLDVATAWSGPEGRFVVEDLPNTPLEVGALREGYKRVSRDGILPGGPEVLLELQRIAGVAGRVLDGITGQPIETFTLRLLPPTLAEGESMPRSFRATWIDGQEFHSQQGYWSTFQDEEFAAARMIAIEASAEGYAPGVLDRLVCEFEPDPDAHVIRLFPGTHLIGQVLDQVSGKPVSGTVLFVQREQGLTWDPTTGIGRDRSRRSILSDADGRFTIPSIPEGEFYLIVRHPSYASKTTPSQRAGRGPAELLMLINLDVGVTLRGQMQPEVRALGVEQIELHAVDVAAAEPQQIWDAEIDEQGSFTFPMISKGLYRLAPLLRSGGAYRPFSQTLVVSVSGEQVVEVGLPVGSAELHGRLIFDASRLGRAFARLQPLDEEGKDRSRFEVPVVDGAFHFAGLPAGRYRLDGRFTRPRGMWVSGSKTLVIAEASKMNTELRVTIKKMR